jgi:thioredoxin reductase (NADPH)
LNRRLGADHQIIAETSPERGPSALQRLRERGGQVAVMIADLWMPQMTGEEFLRRAHQLHPTAQRALLADIFDRSADDAIFQPLAVARADTLPVKPRETADHHRYAVVRRLGRSVGCSLPAEICSPGSRRSGRRSRWRGCGRFRAVGGPVHP